MPISTKIIARFAMTIALAGTVVGSFAGQIQRDIYVNGVRLDAVRIAVLDQLNCGERVPNGLYWLDTTTGAWGFEGGPMQGVVGNCTATQQQNHGGYMEDRIFEKSGISIIQSPVYSQ